MPPPELRIIGVTGLPEVRPGDDLAAMIAAAALAQGTPLAEGDVVVITQKIVSKAEGRVIPLASVTASPFAEKLATEFQKDARVVELVLQESRRIVRMERGVIITETLHGFVCANAGIDLSNLEETDTAALLPADPDLSSSTIRADLLRHTGHNVSIIISDTFGRPWREGCTNIAIGCSGIAPLVDYRGRHDPAGNVLNVTVMAIADELASATEPVMGKLDRIPVAIVRGYLPPQGAASDGAAQELVRKPETDLFR